MSEGKRILILGAGPAGLACAAELRRANQNFILVEKDEAVGGLSRTYQFGDFRTDNGPHRFFSKNPYLYDFIKKLIGEHWIAVDRQTRFFIKGKFYKYPIELWDVLSKIGAWRIARILLDYFKEKLAPSLRPVSNFEEYAVHAFGRSLAEFNILDYTEKIWGMPCSSISAEWATQRIQGLSIMNLLWKMIFKKSGPRTLKDQFFYPDLGAGLIYEAIKKEIEKDNEILLQSVPTQIEHSSGLINALTIQTPDGVRRPTVEWLVSSIPITVFLRLLFPAPPADVLESASKLRFRAQVYLFITINKPSITKDQWIYFPDKEIPFGRVSEMKNFSAKMSPPGKTSLFIEFFCWEGDEMWRKSKEELLATATPWLQKLNLVSHDDIMDAYHIRKPYVYPVYDLQYREELAILEKYLDGFANLIYIGRPGRFKYTNQDHSLEMGIAAARSIIQGKQYDIKNIGSEHEYFEKGYIQS